MAHRTCTSLRFGLALVMTSMGAVAQDGSELDAVVVMTSYPQELVSRYESAFEAAHPSIDMRIEWRRSDDARQLLQTTPAAGVDVYWAPSIDTFAALADAGYFTSLDLPHAGLPGRIGDLQIDDAAGRYAAFEVAGFGFAFSQPWLDAHGLPLPKDWRELAEYRYANAVLVPVPSRQGFSPLLYESILQSSGWEDGWAMITAIAAQSDLMGAGGGDFIDALAEGSHGLALTIDFFPKVAQANGTPVDFRYADTTLFSPAHVALVKTAPHSRAAQTFVDFVLSDAGQRLLLHRDVARLPVRPSAYVDGTVYNPFTGTLSVPAYDFNRSGAHKKLLAAVFDVQITNRHEDLRAAMALLRKAESLAGPNAAETQTRLVQARHLLTAPPISAAESRKLLAILAESRTAAPGAMTAEETTSALPVEAWTVARAEQQPGRWAGAASCIWRTVERQRDYRPHSGRSSHR